MFIAHRGSETMKTVTIRMRNIRAAIAAGSVVTLATLGGTALASADEAPSPAPIAVPADEGEPTETEAPEPTDTDEPTETEAPEPTETDEPTETEAPVPAFAPNPRAVANHNDGRGQDDTRADVRGGGSVDHRAGEHKAKEPKSAKAAHRQGRH
jgi:outer membrane biosynthesis protein TonB